MNSITSITKSDIIGNWVAQFILEYLKESKEKHAAKVLLKVDNLSEEHYKSVIEAFIGLDQEIKEYYKPVVKTVTPVEGYEQFACKENETSVWLRNFIKKDEVLIMIMNANTPEAQSLKDIITIDETQLLAEKNLHSLGKVLQNKKVSSLSIAEIKSLIDFLGHYQREVDSQLSLIASFLVSVINDVSDDLINQKIGLSLNQLRLFNDLSIQLNNGKNLRKNLKSNYVLSSLRKANGSPIEPEAVMKNVDIFIQNEKRNKFESEIWGYFEKDELMLTESILDFVHRKNFDFLKVPFNVANSVFNFKQKNNLKDRLLNTRNEVVQKYIDQIADTVDQAEIEKLEKERLEAETKFDIGMQNVLNKTDLEEIRGFREEFSNDLESEGIIKTIVNIENKLENPSEYIDVFEGIFSEALVLIEEIEDEAFKGNYTFHLSLRNGQSIPEKYKNFFDFHLKSLSKLSVNIQLNSNYESLFSQSSDLPEKIEFNLALYRDEVYLNNSKFSIDADVVQNGSHSFEYFIINLENDELLGEINIESGVPKYNDFVEELNAIRYQSEISGRKLHSHLDSFAQFQKEYTNYLSKVLHEGMTVGALNEIEKHLNEYLSSALGDVEAVRKIHALLNSMGVINESISVSGEVSKKKILSVFNPVRFVAYGYKMIHFSKLIESITDSKKGYNPVRTIEDLQQYRHFEKNKFKTHAPAYLACEPAIGVYTEKEEAYGQGVYLTSKSPDSDSNQSANFAEEVTNIAKDYTKIYPYSTDCLDVLFLYVNNLDYVKKSIDAIMKKQYVSKLNVTIHSPQKAAVLYDEIGQWLLAKEEYTTPVSYLGGLPRVEINVLPHDNNRSLEASLSRTMIDYDIAIFVDYFEQNALKSTESFQPIELPACNFSDTQWKSFKEFGYTSEKEGTRLTNYIANTQPKLLQHFYNLQYTLHKGLNPSKGVEVLKGVISITNSMHNQLYNTVHEKFNWVVTYDRVMDPMLVKQLTNKANIIRYHVNKKGTEDIKVLVSSSDTVRQFITKNENNYYHSRLSNRLKDLLNVKQVSESVINDVVHQVKELSGGSVLRSLGPGKFIHEMLSVYLTVSNAAEHSVGSGVVKVWSMCDELEWFRKNQKRPDLLRLELGYDAQRNKVSVHFNLIELKLVHFNSYTTEVADAEKQLRNGEKSLRAFFDKDDSVLDNKMRIESLINHLIETRSYTDLELSVLNNLNADTQIEFEFSKEIHAYIYNCDVDFVNKNQLSLGHYEDLESDSDIKVHSFTRSYILNKLQAEEKEHEFYDADEERSFEDFFGGKEDSEETDEHMDEGVKGDYSEPQNNGEMSSDIPQNNTEDDEEENKTDEKSSNDEGTTVEPLKEGEPALTIESEDTTPTVEFLENIALKNIFVESESEKQDEEDKKTGQIFADAITSKLAINKINFRVERVIVGSNVIRIIGSLPEGNQSITSIERKTKDMVHWLRIDDEPNVFSDKNGINIDINRPKPRTIQFAEFMELVRKKYTSKELSKQIVAPIGLDPLNNVLSAELSGLEPHMLVAGSTGSGKSVSLNSIVLSLMCLYTEEEVRFVFIDPKQVEFSIFEGTRHTEKVLLNVEDAADYLDILINEMESRYSRFQKEFTKNLFEYNELVENHLVGAEKLPAIIIVFDEFADFMLQDKDMAKRIENTVSRIGQKGRAAGLHMIVCTQSPKAEVINTTIRNNLLARLALKVTDSNASQVVLDGAGAEKLAGKGDFLLGGTRGNPIRGKSPYLDQISYRALLKQLK